MLGNQGPNHQTIQGIRVSNQGSVIKMILLYNIYDDTCWMRRLNLELGVKNMLGGFGVTELLIVLVIVLVLFGVGRISKIAGEMGSGIKAFKDGLQGPEGEEDNPEEEAAKEPEE